ncbi:MAG TPA: hypothetical protein VH479_16270, partial [Acidimicrobiales bacterium]
MAKSPPVAPGLDARPEDAALMARASAIGAALVTLYAVTPASWTTLRGLVLYPAVGLLAAGAVVVGVRRYRPPTPEAWLFVGTGLLLFTLGYVAVGIYELSGPAPFPSVSDVLYLCGYVFLAAGLVIAIRVRRAGGLDPRAGIDAGIIATVGGYLAWLYLARPALDHGELSTAAGVIAAAYVAGDLLMFMIVVRFLLSATWQDTRSLRWLAAGFGLTFAGDLTYIAWIVYGAPPVRFWRLALLVGMLAAGVAALHPTMRALTEERGVPASKGDARGPALVTGVGLVPPLIMAVRYGRGEPSSIPVDVTVWAMLTVLIIA